MFQNILYNWDVWKSNNNRIVQGIHSDYSTTHNNLARGGFTKNIYDA